MNVADIHASAYSCLLTLGVADLFVHTLGSESSSRDLIVDWRFLDEK